MKDYFKGQKIQTFFNLIASRVHQNDLVGQEKIVLAEDPRISASPASGSSSVNTYQYTRPIVIIPPNFYEDMVKSQDQM